MVFNFVDPSESRSFRYPFMRPFEGQPLPQRDSQPSPVNQNRPSNNLPEITDDPQTWWSRNRHTHNHDNDGSANTRIPAERGDVLNNSSERHNSSPPGEQLNTEDCHRDVPMPNSASDRHGLTTADEQEQATSSLPQVISDPHTWWSITRPSQHQAGESSGQQDITPSIPTQDWNTSDTSNPSAQQTTVDSRAWLGRSRVTPRQADEAPSYDVVMGQQGRPTYVTSNTPSAPLDNQEDDSERLQREDSELPSYEAVMEQAPPI